MLVLLVLLVLLVGVFKISVVMPATPLNAAWRTPTKPAEKTSLNQAVAEFRRVAQEEEARRRSVEEELAALTAKLHLEEERRRRVEETLEQLGVVGDGQPNRFLEEEVAALTAKLQLEEERRRRVEETLEAATAQLSAQQLGVVGDGQPNRVAATASAHEAGSTGARTPPVVPAQALSENHPMEGPNFVTLSAKIGGRQTVVRVNGHTLPRSVLPRWECAITAQDTKNYGGADLAARALIAWIKSRLDELASANGNAEYSGSKVRACAILPRPAIQEHWCATCASSAGYGAVRRLRRSQAEVQKYGCVGCDATPHDVERLR